jgi:hypothetical protein
MKAIDESLDQNAMLLEDEVGEGQAMPGSARGRAGQPAVARRDRRRGAPGRADARTGSCATWRGRSCPSCPS